MGFEFGRCLGIWVPNAQRLGKWFLKKNWGLVAPDEMKTEVVQGRWSRTTLESMLVTVLILD